MHISNHFAVPDRLRLQNSNCVSNAYSLFFLHVCVCVSVWLCDKSRICDSTCERTMRSPCICWWREGKRVRLEPILEVMTIHPLCFCSLSYDYSDERKRSLIIYQAALYLIIQIALPTKRIIFLQCASFLSFFFSLSVLCVTSLKMICTAGSVRWR